MNKNAKLEKIVKVLLKVLGNELIYKNIDNKEIDINKETNKDNVWSLALTNEVKNISATELVNNIFLFQITVKDANHKKYSGTIFLDLPDDEYLATGKFDKLLDFDSNPITITFGKRLVDFFGGELIADNFEYKNKKPKYNMKKPKQNADEAMDCATCIGCGACVAACKNGSAMLFVSSKVSQLALLPQGRPEAAKRAKAMVARMDELGFGNCTNTRACEAVCPKNETIANIARLNREFVSAKLKD